MVVPLVGYLDRWSARPGETVAVKVSSQLATPTEADLVRIRCADPNPDGPGMRLYPVMLLGRFPPVAQPVQAGSCGVVEFDTPFVLPDPCTLSVRVQPRLLDGRAQTVLDLDGLCLMVAPGGAGLVAGDEVCVSGAPMMEGRWYELRCVFAAGRVRLVQTALQPTWGVLDSGEGEGACTPPPLRRLLLGARADGAGWTDVLDGRLEDPALHPAALHDPAPLDPGQHASLAWWDFSDGIGTDRFVDRGPHGWHGVFRNMPTRGVRGSRWRGTETCWRHAPRDYAAVHLHADDLYDCGWATTFEWTLPSDLRSGVYGIRLRSGGGHEDTIPIWVLPARGTATAPVAFLASTFTYQAYANHRRFNTDAAYRARQAAWGACPNHPDDHPEYGASTYNRHPDNTGISLSSMRRPMLTVRPGFLTFNDARGSGLRHFPADSHLTDWLEGMAFDYDVITDHDLDREGQALLAPYAVVLTGTHPEYHTAGTLDALGAYTAGGGRLMYLGGNGFYWRIANSDALPDTIEVRRTEGGIRAWSAETGEGHHQLDGAYGGLWRRNGRPPQALVGVGFSAQGLFEGSHYRRLDVGADCAWVFGGVAGPTFGHAGLSGGGAAGFELDRADQRLGTPPRTVILARSEGHQRHFVAVPEELLSHVNTETGENPADLIRAEMILFETANGGGVFATGSITWCGALPVDNYDNDVSRIMVNVLRRFSER